MKPMQLVRSGVGVVLLGIMLFPVYWMVNISLQPGGNALLATWVPTNPSLAGYQTAIRDQGANLVTSLVIACGTVALTLVVATPAAYALAQFRFRFTNAALLALVISQMIPGIVIANGLYALFNDIGLLNSLPGLIIANSAHSVPFSILVMHSFMLNIPHSVMEAAWVDGAGLVRSFWSIAVPVSRNALITSALFTFLFAWSDFIFALTLTTKGLRPVTLGIYTYLGAHLSDWSAVMATAVLASLPAIVLLVAAQKYIAAGASAGAVK